MNNQFFNRAINQASGIAGKQQRLLRLTVQLFDKMRTINWKDVKMATFRDQFLIFGRFCKAYALGHYRNVPLKTVLIIIAAVLYLINPIDLIPDFVPLGLTDDFAVLAWVYSTVTQEIDKFLEWERSNIIIS